MIGWRWWRIDGDRLFSTVRHTVAWEGPTLRADKQPTARNTNGIYALTERGAVWRYNPGPWWYLPFGEIEASGQVVRGELGFRAEIATVRSIHLMRREYITRPDPDGYEPNCFTDEVWPSATLKDRLEARYQVEVKVLDRWPEWMRHDAPEPTYPFRPAPSFPVRIIENLAEWVSR